ncbi:uncharacterized protein L969DRAFT_92223 [Mixia osmundae IAM 14324]|uniref:Uncharacterized protein n=1 Tax=Mixia osmundae (strain CBS 9802 / IAM 14324 / JCM 22182 / KY 12970) TaxID=764103 RepID=G7DTL7_MIXOS|nr:uncharacterized protein L969DRAFT_92223 [Mixia osmundae IAM 14324]KEI42799.1 hypothetical protein L969DRAFT_92223 [Mixia osmundae IAM 14324]GAA93864.1 hypothetical protein E5Q_00510 [Mixia osmundae IAM 14324]
MVGSGHPPIWPTPKREVTRIVLGSDEVHRPQGFGTANNLPSPATIVRPASTPPQLDRTKVMYGLDKAIFENLQKRLQASQHTATSLMDLINDSKELKIFVPSALTLERTAQACATADTPFLRRALKTLSRVDLEDLLLQMDLALRQRDTECEQASRIARAALATNGRSTVSAADDCQNKSEKSTDSSQESAKCSPSFTHFVSIATSTLGASRHPHLLQMLAAISNSASGCPLDTVSKAVSVNPTTISPTEKEIIIEQHSAGNNAIMQAASLVRTQSMYEILVATYALAKDNMISAATVLRTVQLDGTSVYSAVVHMTAGTNTSVGLCLALKTAFDLADNPSTFAMQHSVTLLVPDQQIVQLLESARWHKVPIESRRQYSVCQVSPADASSIMQLAKAMAYQATAKPSRGLCTRSSAEAKARTQKASESE